MYRFNLAFCSILCGLLITIPGRAFPIVDNEECGYYIAQQAAASAAAAGAPEASPEAYLSYGRMLARTLAQLSPEQQTQIFQN